MHNNTLENNTLERKVIEPTHNYKQFTEELNKWVSLLEEKLDPILTSLTNEGPEQPRVSLNPMNYELELLCTRLAGVVSRISL